MKYAIWILVGLHLFVILRNIFKIGFRKYVYGVLIGVDQFYNALLGGDPDETISSRCARGQSKWYWKVLGKILTWIDSDHLIKAAGGN